MTLQVLFIVIVSSDYILKYVGMDMTKDVFSVNEGGVPSYNGTQMRSYSVGGNSSGYKQTGSSLVDVWRLFSMNEESYVFYASPRSLEAVQEVVFNACSLDALQAYASLRKRNIILRGPETSGYQATFVLDPDTIGMLSPADISAEVSLSCNGHSVVRLNVGQRGQRWPDVYIEPNDSPPLFFRCSDSSQWTGLHALIGKQCRPYPSVSEVVQTSEPLTRAIQEAFAREIPVHYRKPDTAGSPNAWRSGALPSHTAA